LNRSQLKIVSEQSEFDFDFIYDELKMTYWANWRTKEQVTLSFKNSYAKMVFYEQQPIAFARIITDWVIFGYLADVVVTEKFRGKGVACLLLTALLNTPEVAEVKNCCWQLRMHIICIKNLDSVHYYILKKIMEKMTS
jgi:hypothetical protein